MHLSELKLIHVSELIKMGEALEIENVARMRKQELMFAIMKKRAKTGEQVFGDGVLEVLPDGFGFLRSPDASYMASTDDIYLSPSTPSPNTCSPALERFFMIANISSCLRMRATSRSSSRWARRWRSKT